MPAASARGLWVRAARDVRAGRASRDADRALVLSDGTHHLQPVAGLPGEPAWWDPRRGRGGGGHRRNEGGGGIEHRKGGGGDPARHRATRGGAVGAAKAGTCADGAAGAGDADAGATRERAATEVGAQGAWDGAGSDAAARDGVRAFGVAGSSSRIRPPAKAAVPTAKASPTGNGAGPTARKPVVVWGGPKHGVRGGK